MTKLVLNDVTNLTNQTSSQQIINDNSDAIVTAMENTLSRDGSTPNQMGADLDMNGNTILNLPQGTQTGEPIEYSQFLALIEELVSGLPGGILITNSSTSTLTNKTIALGSNTISGTTAQFNAALTDNDFATIAGAEILTNKTLTAAQITTSLVPTTDDGAALGSLSNKFSDLFLASGSVINFNSGDVLITHIANVLSFTGLSSVRFDGSLYPTTNDGASLGTTTLMWSDLFLASGAVINFNNSNLTLTHSAAVLTVGGGDLRVTTAGTNAASVVTVGGTQTLTAKTLTTPVIMGVTDASNAVAGQAGEILVANLASGSATSLTTATEKTVISLALTAGDWDVNGSITFTINAATVLTVVSGNISATDNVLDSTVAPGLGSRTGWVGSVTGNAPTISCGVSRFSLSAPATVYLVVRATFTTNTLAAYGYIRARRVR